MGLCHFGRTTNCCVESNTLLSTPQRMKHFFKWSYYHRMRRLRIAKACGICHEDFEDGDMAIYLNCNHMFCEMCIEAWFEVKRTCPSCRAEVPLPRTRTTTETTTTNPIGPIRGKTRVLRGGSFYRTAYECRSSSRDKLDPSWRGSEIGFRVVLGFPLR